MDIKNEVLSYIKEKGGVSYVELENLFDGLGFKWEGDFARCSDLNPNIIFWQGWNKKAIDVIGGLERDGLIEKEVSSKFVYMIDGKVLNLPIVKTDKEYKTEHWLPTEFNSTDKRVK